MIFIRFKVHVVQVIPLCCVTTSLIVQNGLRNDAIRRMESSENVEICSGQPEAKKRQCWDKGELDRDGE